MENKDREHNLKRFRLGSEAGRTGKPRAFEDKYYKGGYEAGVETRKHVKAKLKEHEHPYWGESI